MTTHIENTQVKLREGLNIAANIITSSMGQGGSTVIISQRDSLNITKDGVSIAKSIQLPDPIQNIGAYGVEIKDTFHQLEAIEIETGKTRVFTHSDCNFGYRNSIFKNELKGNYIITSVTFKLTKTNHKKNISYGAIQSLLTNVENPTIKEISDAIISIRQNKLPDPKEIGNSGSFFKNPVIDRDLFNILKEKFPEIPHYIISENEIKIPAGWLIEQCEFKGKRFGDAGVHTKQALVLVNYKNATGQEILNLAQDIQKTVQNKFNINLEIEVNVI